MIKGRPDVGEKAGRNCFFIFQKYCNLFVFKKSFTGSQNLASKFGQKPTPRSVTNGILLKVLLLSNRRQIKTISYLKETNDSFHGVSRLLN